MKKKSIFLMIMTLLCCANLWGQDLISGKYSTNYKEMTLSQNGKKVTGTYSHDNGRLTGELNGHILKGRWYEDGNQTGKFIFTFNDDFSGFTGIWGLNDDDPSDSWNGTRVSPDKSNNADAKNCLDLERKIATLKARIKKNSVAYNKIFSDVENFDKSTRLNFCTQDIDHYTQIGIVEFDDSWNNYFSNLSDNIGLLGDIPVLSTLVDKISEMISVLTIGLDAWETEQMQVDEAFKVYNEMRNIRKGVIDNLIALLQKYYCNNIFEDDQQLYDLYNNIIPNSSMCDAHEKNVLRQEITKNRPDGLPAAIWLEHNYQKIKNNCQ